MFPDSQSRSAALFERARAFMPGANTRHMVTFSPYVIYAKEGRGCRVTDVDGNTYIDWVNNFSANIHGYGFEPIVEALKLQAERMTCCILPEEKEIELAEIIVERWPGVNQVRFANSGTEAVMVALKAARAITGRSKVAKTEGGYHGQYDLVEASFLPTEQNWGPKDRPAAPPLAHGTPQELLDQAVIIPFNDVEVSLARLEEEKNYLAAVIIDPIPARLGFVEANETWLKALRDFCTRNGVPLIFDEVFCGRASFHGAQGRLGVVPDATVLGKIIGGGMPIGAIGGLRSFMSIFDNLAGPLKISHSGTFTANPMSMAAGVAAMRALTQEVFDHLEADGERFRLELSRVIEASGLEMRINGVASMSSLQFFKTPARDYREFHQKSGANYMERMRALHSAMLNAGVLMATRGLMIGSTAMNRADIDETVERTRTAFEQFAQAKAA
jgi:glutamate-1-semialdehyde 2,1-aminomutase